jgi:hypothetical protein
VRLSTPRCAILHAERYVEYSGAGRGTHPKVPEPGTLLAATASSSLERELGGAKGSQKNNSVHLAANQAVSAQSSTNPKNTKGNCPDDKEIER